jgi:HTH-type transcriptional regulator / antitoxin HipB
LHALLKVCYNIHIEKDVIAYMVQLAIRTPADVGAIIKDRRRALGLDQAELAERIGVGRLWVNQVERGKSGASLGLVLRALAAVGVELSAGERGQKFAQAELNSHDAIAAEMLRRRDE